MSQTVEAVYDGRDLKLQTALGIAPNTRVKVTVEVIPAAPRSFLDTARSLNLEGPSDWSERSMS